MALVSGIDLDFYWDINSFVCLWLYWLINSKHSLAYFNGMLRTFLCDKNVIFFSNEFFVDALEKNGFYVIFYCW